MNITPIKYDDRFSGIRECKYSSSTSKTEFGFNGLCFLGYGVENGGIKPMMSKALTSFARRHLTRS